MRYISRHTRTRLHVVVCLTALVAACGEPTATPTQSSFTADVRGAVNERITGSAIASTGDWGREAVVQVTLPNIGTFSGIVLAASDNKSTISLIRSGTELPVGTHRIGLVSCASPTPPAFTAGYVIQRSDELQVFIADSGTVSITGTGSRVTGTFTVYGSSYFVMARPTPDMVGKPITPKERGRSPVTITGKFDAGRR